MSAYISIYIVDSICSYLGIEVIEDVKSFEVRLYKIALMVNNSSIYEIFINEVNSLFYSSLKEQQYQ